MVAHVRADVAQVCQTFLSNGISPKTSIDFLLKNITMQTIKHGFKRQESEYVIRRKVELSPH